MHFDDSRLLLTWKIKEIHNYVRRLFLERGQVFVLSIRKQGKEFGANYGNETFMCSPCM